MYLNAYTAGTGQTLSPAEKQAAFEHISAMLARLQLSGSNRLPTTWEEALRWYDNLADDTLADTETLRDAIRNVRRPAMPDFLPRAATPAWWLIGPIVGHVLLTLGIGIMRPRVRELTGLPWSRLQQAEFAALTQAIQTANRILPKRMTYTPLAYNRWRYERLVAKYQAMGPRVLCPRPPCPRLNRGTERPLLPRIGLPSCGRPLARSGRLSPMSSDADTARMADSGTRAPLRWLTVAAAQACLIAGLAWLWSTGSSDAAATSVDWEFVSLVAVTPLSLAASGWIGWRAHKPAGADQAGPIGGLATVTQWLTLGLLVLTLPIAPLVIFGAVIFGPMG